MPSPSWDPSPSDTGRVALEDVLRQREVDLDRELAGQAGRAEAGPGNADGRRETVWAQEVDAVDPDVVGHLSDLHLGGAHLAAGADVDPVEAGPLDRRERDAQVALLGPCVAQHLHRRPLRRPTHDRVVDDDETLAV